MTLPWVFNGHASENKTLFETLSLNRRLTRYAEGFREVAYEGASQDWQLLGGEVPDVIAAMRSLGAAAENLRDPVLVPYCLRTIFSV